jgi:hypothetical protein
MLAHPSVNLSITVAQNLCTVSDFALYLVAPYYLSTRTINSYNTALGRPQIEEHILVLAQKNSQSSSFTVKVPKVN